MATQKLVTILLDEVLLKSLTKSAKELGIARRTLISNAVVRYDIIKSKLLEQNKEIDDLIDQNDYLRELLKAEQEEKQKPIIKQIREKLF